MRVHIFHWTVQQIYSFAPYHRTVLNVHIVLYILCTVQDQLPDGLADRPLLFPSFGVHLSSLLVILSTLCPLGRLPNPSRRDVV
jgi:hypothetical protein